MNDLTEPRRFDFHADLKLESEVIVQQDALRHLDRMGEFDRIRKESKHLLVADKNLEKLYLCRV